MRANTAVLARTFLNLGGEMIALVVLQAIFGFAALVASLVFRAVATGGLDNPWQPVRKQPAEKCVLNSFVAVLLITAGGSAVSAFFLT